jgi:hypothetical protein
MLRNPAYDRDLELLRARIDLTIQSDGALKGYVGGYRPWEPIYNGWVNARGPVIEALTWVQLPAVYYALKRNADYSPKGSKGEKTHISYALRVSAIPAYVLTPSATRAAGADGAVSQGSPARLGRIDLGCPTDHAPILVARSKVVLDRTSTGYLGALSLTPACSSGRAINAVRNPLSAAALRSSL